MVRYEFFGSNSIERGILSCEMIQQSMGVGLLLIHLVLIRQFSWFGMKQLLLLVGRLLWWSTKGGFSFWIRTIRRWFDSDSKGLEQKKDFDNPLQEEGDDQYTEQLCKLESRTNSNWIHSSKLTNQFFLLILNSVDSSLFNSSVVCLWPNSIRAWGLINC